MPKNIRLIVSYDGSAYSGWQRQTNAPSVQGAIETAIEIVCEEFCIIHGSGRTDAGVHAIGQVAMFSTLSLIPPERFADVLNDKLPFDIRILFSDEAPDGFHPRFSAKGKRYIYRLDVKSIPCPLRRNIYAHTTYPIDINLMKNVASVFVGTHDFTSFTVKPEDNRNHVRTITHLEITKINDTIEINIQGNGFLRYMVRRIVGTLIDAGRGYLTVENVLEIISAKDVKKGGPTAPANGLCLEEVFYND